MPKNNYMTRLIKVRSEVSSVKKRGSNPHFRSSYATLEDVIAEVTDPLAANGFYLGHITGADEYGKFVSTTFFDAETGDEAISTRIPLVLGKQDMQGLGSAITYARRYGILSLLNLPTEDDDGNGTVGRGSRETTKDRARVRADNYDF